MSCVDRVSESLGTDAFIYRSAAGSSDYPPGAISWPLLSDEGKAMVALRVAFKLAPHLGLWTCSSYQQLHDRLQCVKLYQTLAPRLSHATCSGT